MKTRKGQPRPQGPLGIQIGGLDREDPGKQQVTSPQISQSQSPLQIWSNQNLQYFWRHVTSWLPGSSPSRHFERREDPGDEIGGTVAILVHHLGFPDFSRTSKPSKLIKN